MADNKYFLLGLGAAKSGTTTLASLLQQHPQIQVSKIGKEVHFFDEKFERGQDWYLELFENNSYINLDFTPSYLFDTKCRDKTFELFQKVNDVKFIVILRNPFDRAYSHYCHAVNHWWKSKYRHLGYPEETLSFYEALLAEDQRLKSGQYHIRHQSYYNKGLYDRQLEYYFEKFSKSRFFIIIFEEFLKNYKSVLASLYHWLGIDANFAHQQELVKINSQTKGKIPREAIEFLWEKFEPSIKNLEILLEKDLSFWRIPYQGQASLQKIKSDINKTDIKVKRIQQQIKKIV